MEGELTIVLTVEQASELFSRCLASTLDDTLASVAAMQRLADALYDSGAFAAPQMKAA